MLQDVPKGHAMCRYSWLAETAIVIFQALNVHGALKRATTHVLLLTGMDCAIR